MEDTVQSSINQQQPVEQMLMRSPQPVKSSPKIMWYSITAVVILVVIIGGAYMLVRKSYKTMPQTTTQQPTMQPKPTLPRSKALGIITNVVTASSLDALGNAVTPTSTFSATTKTIYLAVTLNNAKVGTKVEYVRYLNGKYLDKNALKIIKPNTANTSFVWSLAKPTATHLVGAYRVKVYTNGVFEKETTFVIQ